MVGSRPERLSATLPKRIRLFEQTCEKFYLLINKMPAIEIPNRNVVIVDIKKDTFNFNDSIHPLWLSTLMWLFNSVSIHIKMSLSLFKISREVDIVCFGQGLPFLLPLILEAKFLRKKILLVVGGPAHRSFAAAHPRARISFHVLKMLEMSCYLLSDKIGVETEGTVHFMGIDRFKNKIISGASIYLDSSFTIECDLKDRENLVGYIGNLIEGKGVMNFLDATKLILRQRDDVKFLIGGDGPLLTRIKDKIENDGLQFKFEIIGWIKHEEMAYYLNKLRLLVLPSYSEGLPVIILEAMSCGTLVLATPVGGVSDVVKDGETGFILEDNSSECIARSIMKVLEHQDLDSIIKKAQGHIENNYTFEAMLETYSMMLKQVLAGGIIT
jgi:glycosyltransferase involved in cell wall biosynthesis